MRKIVLANQKGGVGKTTTAVNLAVGLSEIHKKRVLLIDLDPQANATFSLLGYQEPDITVQDVLLGDDAPQNAIFRDVAPNLDLIPSDIDLAAAETQLPGAIGGQTRLRNKLAHISGYDFIIIDAPPSLGLLTINALTAADEVIIPVSVSVFALKGIVQLERTISQVKNNLDRPDLRIGGVLCTLDDHTTAASEVKAAIRARFGDLTFDTIIPKNISIEEAHSKTESLYTYAPASTGAAAYMALVEEVLQRG